uniref:Uncharacterized protein n=1 Tax=Brassica campestris TaxID=3711 RepID=A0A3P6AFK5_BRACM|nr:unnamed protein product [Brassica rapa]
MLISSQENVASHLQCKFRSALKKITNEANQQANMAAIDSHFMQMSALKGLGGFHNQRQIPLGSGQFHGGAATMRHYPLGRLNSFGGSVPTCVIVFLVTTMMEVMYFRNANSTIR